MKIAIITDIHENVVMLEAVIRKAEAMGCDELACLGDIAGYDHRFYNYPFLPSARQCVSMVRRNCRWVVAGNHDLFAAGKMPAYTNGFMYPDEWFRMPPAERKISSGGRVWSFDGEAPNDLGEEEKEYLDALPEYGIINEDGLNLLLSHYVCPDFTGSTTLYVEKQNHTRQLWEFMAQNKIDLSLSGHSHKPFAYIAHPRTFAFQSAVHPLPSDSIFLGSEKAMLLLPPVTTGNGRTSFSVLETGTRTLSVVHEKVTRSMI